MYIDNLVDVAKKELSWEVDYSREAECTKKFKKLLEPHEDYYVPEVIGKFVVSTFLFSLNFVSKLYRILFIVLSDELCTNRVFTSELIEGIPVDKCVDMDFESKCRISLLIQILVLHEMFVFRFMQTDPNWSNFFYNPNTRKVHLIKSENSI